MCKYCLMVGGRHPIGLPADIGAGAYKASLCGSKLYIQDMYSDEKTMPGNSILSIKIKYCPMCGHAIDDPNLRQ